MFLSLAFAQGVEALLCLMHWFGLNKFVGAHVLPEYMLPASALLGCLLSCFPTLMMGYVLGLSPPLEMLMASLKVLLSLSFFSSLPLKQNFRTKSVFILKSSVYSVSF